MAHDPGSEKRTGPGDELIASFHTTRHIPALIDDAAKLERFRGRRMQLQIDLHRIYNDSMRRVMTDMFKELDELDKLVANLENKNGDDTDEHDQMPAL